MDEQQPQEPPYRAVYFHVTDGAQSEMLSGFPMLYVGVTYRIPRAKIEEAQHVFEMTNSPESAQQIIAGSDIEPMTFVSQVMQQGYQPVPEAILERFDTLDSESGDILVLLRIPCTVAVGGQETGGLSEAA